MISMLKNWKGAVEINSTEYNSIQEALQGFNADGKGNIHIVLKTSLKTADNSVVANPTDGNEVVITVKPYMTKKATPEFDFMAKWNNDVPMPIRTMQGVVTKETRGMVYMKLHGLAKPTINCLCCGKELTNPISRQYGIGPVCLAKAGIVADIEDVDNIKEQLVNMEWEGWIIKSAIVEEVSA